MKKGPNPTIFLGLALVTLLAGGGVVFMQFSAMSEQASKVERLKRDTKDEKTINAELAKSKLQLDECSAQLAHLEQGVTAAEYIPTMLKELESTGRSNGIEVTGVRPMPVLQQAKKNGEMDKKKKKSYQELDIEVKGRGSYSAVTKFMTALQKFPKIVAARMVDLAPQAVGAANQTSNQKPDGGLDVTIDLRAYVFAAADDSKKPAGKSALYGAGGKPNVG